MAELSTIFGLATEIKERLNQGRFKGTKNDVKDAQEAYKESVKTNRELGQDLKSGKITKLDYDSKKEDTWWYKNRLNMLEDKPFYFEIDNRFPNMLWGKERSKWKISSEVIKKKSSDQIEKLIIGRLKRGLEYSIEKEERPRVAESLENFLESVNQYNDALEDGKRPKEIITGRFDFDEPEIEIEITGS